MGNNQLEASIVLKNIKPVKAILTKRVSPEEWDARKEELTFIPAGTIVVELPDFAIRKIEGLRSIEPTRLNYLVNLLVKDYLATPLTVVGHAKTDLRPLCLDINGEGVPSDLPLVPIALLGEE